MACPCLVSDFGLFFLAIFLVGEQRQDGNHNVVAVSSRGRRAVLGNEDSCLSFRVVRRDTYFPFGAQLLFLFGDLCLLLIDNFPQLL